MSATDANAARAERGATLLLVKFLHKLLRNSDKHYGVGGRTGRANQQYREAERLVAKVGHPYKRKGNGRS